MYHQDKFWVTQMLYIIFPRKTVCFLGSVTLYRPILTLNFCFKQCSISRVPSKYDLQSLDSRPMSNCSLLANLYAVHAITNSIKP